MTLFAIRKNLQRSSIFVADYLFLTIMSELGDSLNKYLKNIFIFRKVTYCCFQNRKRWDRYSDFWFWFRVFRTWPYAEQVWHMPALYEKVAAFKPNPYGFEITERVFCIAKEKIWPALCRTLNSATLKSTCRHYSWWNVCICDPSDPKPCGTPQLTTVWEDWSWPKLTWNLPEKDDLNQPSANAAS